MNAFDPDALPLPILISGDPRLREHSAEIAGVDSGLIDEASRLIATLRDFRERSGFGRAISAVQVGVMKRMVAMNLGAGPFILINPEITWRSDETFLVWDDCLSVPDVLVHVRRHLSISLTYRDHRFRVRRWNRLPPDLSELIQHELDHLSGTLMTDRAEGEGAIQPLSRWAELVGAARPASRLSLDRIIEAPSRIDPVFLNTPQYDCEPLSAVLGAKLTLKVETANPIRNFKGRGVSFFVSGSIDAGTALAEGAGTIGLELLARDDAFDAVLVPVGNGALLNGVARWLKAASPATEVIGVSALAAPAMERSWRNGPGGAIVETATAETIADGVAVRTPIAEAVGDMFGLVDDVVLVDDDLTRRAMFLLREHAGLIVEPAGALGVAAILMDPARYEGRTLATVVCGGNLRTDG